MAINNFIPSVWHAGLLRNLNNGLVYGGPSVINRNYEGEISKMGNTVRITSIGPVTVTSYSKNTNLGDPETLTDAQLTLVIDQSDSFNFQIDDIDAAQAAGSIMDEAMYESGYALQTNVDTHLSTVMAAGVHTSNILGGTSPISTFGTATEAYKYLVKLGVLLSARNAPKDGRFAVIPPWFHGLLQQDERFVGVGSNRSDDVLTNGFVGRAAGFDLMESNTVPVSGTTYQIIAGHRIATTYADQITELVGYRPEKRFADAVKGLHVYGSKVVKPAALAKLYANDPG